MKLVRCIAGAGEFGDCYRACIASILEMPPEQVPHFGALSTDSEEMKVQLRAWLADRGLALFENWVSGQWSLEKVLKLFSKDSPGAPFILHGEAAIKGAGDINHAVVALDGKIHDPSGAGICGPCVNIEGERLHWWIDVITLANPARLAA
jgi:hypothetical protein